MGSAGPPGEKGAMGPAGLPGEKRTMGPPGPVGKDRATGLAGPRGLKGPVGPPGPVGPRGLKGPVGPPGPTGMSQSPSPAGPAKALIPTRDKSLSCSEDYKMWRGICYKVINTVKTFSDAATACREDGGTLAMPRDAETNDFLVSLSKSVSDRWYFWIGLHRQRAEGKFEWMDGSALGDYSSWAPGEPSHFYGIADCVSYSAHRKGKWSSWPCNRKYCFICQVAPDNFVDVKFHNEKLITDFTISHSSYFKHFCCIFFTLVRVWRVLKMACHGNVWSNYKRTKRQEEWLLLNKVPTKISHLNNPCHPNCPGDTFRVLHADLSMFVLYQVTSFTSVVGRNVAVEKLDCKDCKDFERKVKLDLLPTPHIQRTKQRQLYLSIPVCVKKQPVS
uniref:C-type lectin domain-containing protein n=1 Tax=Branchiostoma floridae TaxID=7739 RepID=C3XY81_BRAFL|eukprot:XP_002610756.1 hypothetical protein BRAFLDRAFT_126306 [Branchiostoma floridae]